MRGWALGARPCQVLLFSFFWAATWDFHSFELGATRRDFLYDFDAGILKVIPNDDEEGTHDEATIKTKDLTVTLKAVDSQAIETIDTSADMNSIGTHGAVS